jgi:hypothetical protein
VLKFSDIRGFLIGLLVIAAIAAVVLWRVLSSGPPHPPSPPPSPAPQAEAVDCRSPAWQAAAAANQASLYTLVWSPFGKPETGWATYAPLVGHEIGSRCAADTAGFAASYAAWQKRQGLPTDGIVKPGDFDKLRDALALRRPFVQQTAKGLCPAAPDEATLVSASPQEAYGGKTVQLRPGALAAYRKMVAAARAAGIGARPPALQLLSGYRGPTEEASRCSDGGCNKLTRASCSAHRTGLAIDLYLEPAAGADPTSSDDANRRHMAATAEYRWLVANASRFGFLPYAYEPWHWEWTGETP